MSHSNSKPKRALEKECWVLSSEDLFASLQTHPKGLADEEVIKRQQVYGLNELQKAKAISPWSILAAQFKNVLILILLLATAVSFLLGHGVEAVAITIIVFFAVILGFVQEYRAERAMEALSRMSALNASVIRAGKEMEVPADELVPGDVIRLEVGDKVPADARLFEAQNLQIDEAVLTGESVPSEKHQDVLLDKNLPVGDRKNMAYAGTIVTYGRGVAVVVSTGMATEFGKITGMLQAVQVEKTPLQKNLDRVGHILACIALVIVALIVGLGLLRGQPFIEMFLFGIALAVAVVPEALPAVVTVALAVGVQRMVKRNALMRRLPVVETLGSTSVICSDKTGTLTRNEMTVLKIFVAGQSFDVTGSGYEPTGRFLQNGQTLEVSQPLQEILRAGILASDAKLIETEGRWSIQGDPTEGALITVAAKAGFKKEELDVSCRRIDEIPFSSETKRMSVLCEIGESHRGYSKGAPEIILDSCNMFLSESGETTLDAQAKTSIADMAQSMANEALRVIAIAYKKTSTVKDVDQDMVFLGLFGLKDPARAEAKDAINTCESAGIKVVMITGDHPLTAKAVATELGLLKVGRIITGIELDDMSDRALESQVEDIDVYARVSPAHKLRVVSAFQKRGHIVAMTGDGVNDAPALKKADIGVAMGITGTDVSREVAAMTLIDDNFASIVAAVEEGRGIFENIKKFLMYLLSSNLGEIALMTIAAILGLPLPLSAVQILYVNLASDGLPALALAVDPVDDDLMRRRPRDPKASIFSKPVIGMMLVGGLWSAVMNLTLFIYILNSGRSLQDAMSVTFVSLVLIQFIKTYSYRSDCKSFFKKPFNNKWLNRAIIWESFLLLLILYVPALSKLLGVSTLSMQDWVLVHLAGFSVLLMLELYKWLDRHIFLRRQRVLPKS